jgi:hypothetical protein
MEKICLIYQPCGLGDIIFIQKVCKFYLGKGFRVILPVVYEFEWLNDYIEQVEFISWGDTEKKLTHWDKLPENIEFPYKGRYDPFAPHFFSDEFVFLNFFQSPNGRVMESKYNSINMGYEDWVDYFSFKRNYDKEDELFHRILGIKEGEEYVLVNKNYQTRPEVVSLNRINSDVSIYNKRVIEMSIIDGFTLFDWSKVIQNAKQIHTVDTSLIMLIEKLDLIKCELYLYPRGHSGDVDYLLKKNWIIS